MENMAGLEDLFGGIYKDRRVLVTGHTGFKGSWLTYWLTKLKAKVVGYALKPPTQPNHFELLNLPIVSVEGDIRDRKLLFQVFKEYKPEIVFHLAAQPYVRYSYIEPMATFEINVIGTLNILEAVRQSPSTKVLINITSDKCYENKEWFWGYREDDPLGGYDPYSASKACSEIITAAYRRSFFSRNLEQAGHKVYIATTRAGNVIGGGDWGMDRIIPDIIKATFENRKVIIRSPNAVRPWQHVLEPLTGYLFLGQRLFEENEEFATAWNFGPYEKDCISVIDLVKKIKNIWSKVDYEIQSAPPQFHENILLRLDCSKARFLLGWEPIWNIDKAIIKTIEWYRAFYEKGIILTEENLYEYINDAKIKRAKWI